MNSLPILNNMKFYKMVVIVSTLRLNSFYLNTSRKIVSFVKILNHDDRTAVEIDPTILG